LLANHRGFQRIKECIIWIPCAKGVRVQSLVANDLKRAQVLMLR